MSDLYGKNRITGVLLLFFAAIYILLPCRFSSTDAWYYAACIKYNTELFHPFHLIYNLFGKIICFIPENFGIDTLACLKIMNAFFAVMSLYVVMHILQYMKKKKSEIILITALCGASFSVMRYATENETYIVPLFLGLVSSYFFITYILSARKQAIFLSFFFASLSVLLHLSYIFWLLSILAGIFMVKDYKILLQGLIISLIIPVAYILAVYVTQGSLNYDAIKEFAGGRSFKGMFSVSLSGLLLSVISLARSFIQVHGYMINMLKESWFNFIPALLSICFFISAMLHLKDLKWHIENRTFVFTHVLIAVLMLIFAVVSEGNAEFMVMIPVLVFIITGIIVDEGKKFYTMLLTGMLIWNLFYGLIPLNRISGESEKYLCNMLVENNDIAVIARDDQQIASMVFYYTGKESSHNIYKSPAVLKIRGKNPEILKGVIDSLLVHEKKVFTDCLSIMPMSRAVFLEGKINQQFFSAYLLKEEKRWENTGGIRIIHRITGKKS